MKEMKRTLTFETEEGLYCLQAVMPHVIRCVHTRESRVEDPSELIASHAIQSEALAPVAAPSAPAEGDLTLSSGELQVTFDRKSGRLTWLRRADGSVLLREGGHELTAREIIRYTTGDEPPVIERVKTVDGERNFIKNLRPVKERSAWRAKLSFDFEQGEGIYGLGQTENGVWNRRHQNEYLYQHNMRIPMPFLLSGKGYGILVDCGSLMTFQDDALGSYLFLDTVNQLDYYFILGDGASGNRFDSIIAALRWLTGKAALLPRWAFGYIQSRERYRTAAELADTVRRYREAGVPLDGIVQDWHTWTENHWGEKKVDPQRYGDLKERLREVHDLHAHAMVSVWPNMNANTDDWEEFQQRGWLLNDLSTYDAFNPQARELFWQQAKRELYAGGFDAWWCDSTEPFSGPDWGGESLREPWERYQLVGEEHKRFLPPQKANLYALSHARGIYENQRKEGDGKRVLNLTRSGYAGSQRYGVVLWSGDISARWDVLEKQVTEAVRVACSGIPWWTLDIGGFFVDRKDPWFWRGDYPAGVQDPDYRELYIRWFQFGSMLPVFRSHGTDTPREPWVFGAEDSPEYNCLKETIRLRYRLLPYLYSEAARCCSEGLPMIRAMLTAFGGDTRVSRLADQYMLGGALLVKPVTRPLREAAETEILLPEGGWYDLFTHQFRAGGAAVSLHASLDRFPVFVRAGSILPVSAGACSTAELASPADELLVFSGSDGAFTLYDDAGDGMDYLCGEYMKIPLRWDDRAQTLTIGASEGSLLPDTVLRVRLYRPDGSEETCELRYTGKPVKQNFR